jgi:hypothetical protein
MLWWSVLLVTKSVYSEKTTDKIDRIMLYRVDFTWAGFELTTLVVIGTCRIGSCKSIHQTTTTKNSHSSTSKAITYVKVFPHPELLISKNQSINQSVDQPNNQSINLKSISCQLFVHFWKCELFDMNRKLKLWWRTTITSHLSCNNVAPVTNLCLGRATTRSHSSQWRKQKLQLKHKNSLFTLQSFHYNYYWWSQSLLIRFGWEIYAFQR